MNCVANEHETAGLVAALFPHDYVGIYVDVGAGYPEYYSNSNYFRQRGWQIIAIEPQPQMCAEFKAQGYPILEYACAAQDIGWVDFEVLDNTRGLAGSAFKILDDHPRSAITAMRVEAYTLETLLARFHPELDHIDVLDIDVEYYELEVLAGFNIERWRPKVMVIEDLPSTWPWCNPHPGALTAYYADHRYTLVGQASYNQITVRNEDL